MVSLDDAVGVPWTQVYQIDSFSLPGWPFAPDKVAVQSCDAEEDPGSVTDMGPWAAAVDQSTVYRHF